MTVRSAGIRGATRANRETSRTPCEHTQLTGRTSRHIFRGPTTWCALLFTLLASACAAPIESEPSEPTTEESDLESAPSKDLQSTAIDGGRSGSGSIPPPTAMDAGAPDASEAAAPPALTPQAILAKLQGCVKASTAPYARDSGGTANIDVCAKLGAVFWNADLDVDCDGKQSTVCNKSTDASYQSQTAATDSKGAPLDASTLPFIVVPGVSTRWSYKAAGISMGSVGLVIYNGKMEYGIVGDVGPTSIIGEASYAMAQRLGINPDPSIGGTSSGVTYVIFTGPTSLVKTKEDHAEAVTIGTKKAEELVQQN